MGRQTTPATGLGANRNNIISGSQAPAAWEPRGKILFLDPKHRLPGSQEEKCVNQTDDVKTIHLLSKGIMELYEPPLATINTHLKELTERQEAVHTMLSSERRKLEDLQNDAMVDAMFADIATNREKLVSISNSMMGLHKRVQSLQVRAAMVEKAAKNRASNQSKLTGS